MYHHGLVKILVEFHLQSIGDDWECFLIRNHFEEKSPEKPSSNKILRGRKRTIEMTKEQAPQTQTEVTEEELPIVKILQRMKRGNPRRKKASPGKEELSQIETSSLKGKSENKRRKVQEIQTPGLRRSTRLSTTQQTTPKTIEYINLEENEPTEEEPTENTLSEIEPIEDEPIGRLGDSPKGSPRSSPQPYSSPLGSPIHSPSIDPVQQEIYDYIESLERKVTTTKETIQSPGEGSNQVNEQSASNILKQEIFELETLNRYLKNENQALKTQSEI